MCPPQKTVYGASVIIFEGIMAFADKKLLQVRQGVFPLTCWNIGTDISANIPNILIYAGMLADKCQEIAAQKCQIQIVI